MRDEVGNSLIAPNRVALKGVTSRQTCGLPNLGSQCLIEIALPGMNARPFQGQGYRGSSDKSDVRLDKVPNRRYLGRPKWFLLCPKTFLFVTVHHRRWYQGLERVGRNW